MSAPAIAITALPPHMSIAHVALLMYTMITQITMATLNSFAKRIRTLKHQLRIKFKFDEPTVSPVAVEMARMYNTYAQSDRQKLARLHLRTIHKIDFQNHGSDGILHFVDRIVAIFSIGFAVFFCVVVGLAFSYDDVAFCLRVFFDDPAPWMNSVCHLCFGSPNDNSIPRNTADFKLARFGPFNSRFFTNYKENWDTLMEICRGSRSRLLMVSWNAINHCEEYNLFLRLSVERKLTNDEIDNLKKFVRGVKNHFIANLGRAMEHAMLSPNAQLEIEDETIQASDATQDPFSLFCQTARQMAVISILVLPQDVPNANCLEDVSEWLWARLRENFPIGEAVEEVDLYPFSCVKEGVKFAFCFPANSLGLGERIRESLASDGKFHIGHLRLGACFLDGRPKKIGVGASLFEPIKLS